MKIILKINLIKIKFYWFKKKIIPKTEEMNNVTPVNNIKNSNAISIAAILVLG